MKEISIPYQKTGLLSPLVNHYLQGKEQLARFHGRQPTLENLIKQAGIKLKHFSDEKRKILVTNLTQSYQNIELTEQVSKNLTLLRQSNSVTLTTGHQLCLMTGPLFFIYKIVSTIKLCLELSKQTKDYHFIPVFWMASEDHDFEEINHFVYKNERYNWNNAFGGAVGRQKITHLMPILTNFLALLDKGVNAQHLKKMILEAYDRNETLSMATKRLVHALFSKWGLLVLDPDNRNLKQLFSPYIKRELTTEFTFNEVSRQIEQLKIHYDKNYKPQVNPRKINLFYLTKNQRTRIEKEGSTFFTANPKKFFSEESILSEIEQHTDCFSPNVLLRPLYQEVILPNIAYIGGNGELSYWLELKAMFDSQNVIFPILLMRNSILLLDKSAAKKCRKLNITDEDFFLSKEQLITKKIHQLSNINMKLDHFRRELATMFSHLQTLVKKTDGSFVGAVKAQQAKQFKGITMLEKRLLKSQKRAMKAQLDYITAWHDKIFPNQEPQERYLNFSNFYADLGEQFIPMLLTTCKPIAKTFTIIDYQNCATLQANQLK